MKTRQLIISAALLAMTGGAIAQTAATTTMDAPTNAAAMSPANGASNDPYVQKRQADADAKAQYKAQKKAVNQQSRADKKAAKRAMKQEKREATAERNAELAQPQAKTDLNKGH